MWFTLASSVLGFLGGGNVKAVIEGVRDVAKNRTNADVTKTVSANEAGQALASRYFETVDRSNEWKAKTQTVRQVVFGMLAFAAPTALLFWAAALDSIPFYVPYLMDTPHVVGSWGVDLPPKLESSMLRIIDSFFIAAPIVGSVSVLASVFAKK